MKYKTKQFTFKHQMVEYIADYYSDVAKALNDKEYQELEAIYLSVEEVENDKSFIDQFKDFDIYRLANGDWLISRIA